MEFFVLSEDAGFAKELVAAAKAQGDSLVTAFVFGQEAANSVAVSGATNVACVSVAEGAMKEEVAPIVAEAAKASGEAVVLVASSKRMVDAASRIAKHLGTAPIADAKCYEGGVAKHMVYGGKSMVSDKAVGSYSVVLVGRGLFEPLEEQPPCPIEQVELHAGAARVMENRKKTSESVDLTAAKAIVCLGRGVADEDGFEMCKGLASAIGAELGCTRPVTETEKPLMPRSAYIGSSGNTVKPGLFVSVTASGQTQFVMGMYESGKIVAVNKDPNALIFRQCDYGIVGDYTEIVPAITKALGA